MKRFNLLVSIFLAAVGMALLIAPPAWVLFIQDVHFTGVSILVWVAVVYFLPQGLKVSENAPDAANKNQATELLQFLLVVAVAGDALGSLGLYKLYTTHFGYDKALHFFVPFLGVAIVYAILRIRFMRQRYAALGIAFGVVVGCAVGWEVVEYVCDLIFNSHLQGFYRADIYADTVRDLLYGLAGSGIGVVCAKKISKIVLPPSCQIVEK